METNHQKSVPLVNEVIGVFAASVCAQDEKLSQDFVADPKGTLTKTAGISVPADTSVRAVRNTASEVNLVIPAYSALESVATKAALKDADVSKISGGEIVVVAVLTVAGVGVAAVGGTAAGVFGMKEIQKKAGKKK